MSIKIGSWVTTPCDRNSVQVVIERVKPDMGVRRVRTMAVDNGRSSLFYLPDLRESHSEPALVAQAKRSDDFIFTMVTWGKGRSRRVVLRAGCRFHHGVKSALARWKPGYRAHKTQPLAYRKKRRALNTESRHIVKALAKQLGVLP